MPVISLLPAEIHTARVVALLTGSEWPEFDAVLATKLRFAEDGRPFPARGTVSIRRGLDHAADRLAARLHSGLPALALSFDAAGGVITADAAGGAGDCCFRLQTRSWEAIASATLTQRTGTMPPCSG